eukprot:5033448-Prymnesium_polylepis.1
MGCFATRHPGEGTQCNQWQSVQSVQSVQSPWAGQRGCEIPQQGQPPYEHTPCFETRTPSHVSLPTHTC